jgi:sugar lactone lactonase YvrE
VSARENRVKKYENCRIFKTKFVTMVRLLIILLFTCTSVSVRGQGHIITTIAGKAGVPASYYGDSIPATNARFYGPCAVCYDNNGNLLVCDAFNSRIRRISLGTGLITTIAGTNTAGFSGDGGLASSAELALPETVRTDSVGSIYITDGQNNRIRKIDAITGIITTIAGNGSTGNSGDGGPATNAQMDGPVGLCLDKNGNIYFTDYFNNRVRKIDASTGVISAFAGTGAIGYSGDNGLAINARFSSPVQVFGDAANNIFICDQFNHVVRKVDAITGIITTTAGAGVPGYSGDSGLAIHAKLNEPAGGLVDKNNDIYIAEFQNGVIRKIDHATGIITTVAGNGTWGWAGDGGPPTDAKLSCTDLVIDSFGQMIIADYGTNTIRKVYDPKLAVSQQTALPEKIIVYPNPAQNELTIAYSFSHNMDAVFHMTDITGRVVATRNLSSREHEATINIRSLSPGLYLYKVMRDGRHITSGNIIKE